MSDFEDSAPYKRLKGLLDMPDNGSPEMAKAKEVAQRRLGELATSRMAKTAGTDDPFKMERVKDPETGKTKMSPQLLPEEIRDVKAVSRPRVSGGGGSGTGGAAADLKMLNNPKAMKKGGKVAGKLATRGYGKAR